MSREEEPPLPLTERLERFELLVVTGKGGVGKSAVSAALGLLLARRGRRVRLIETARRETLYHFLEVDPSDGRIVAAAPRLELVNLRPRDELDRQVRERLGIPVLTRRILRSSIYRHFVEGAPGLKELVVLDHAEQAVPARADVVVLDAPATGHALSLLLAPALVSEAIAGGPFGQRARELSTLVADGRRCGVVLVTRAEDLPVQETLELRAALRQRIGRDAELLVANGLFPPLEDEAEGDDAVRSAWYERRRSQERQLLRLEADRPLTTVTLPLLPAERGGGLIERLARLLEDRVAVVEVGR